MLYIILGYLFVSGLLAALFWMALIAAKRSDENTVSDFPEEKLNDK